MVSSTRMGTNVWKKRGVVSQRGGGSIFVPTQRSQTNLWSPKTTRKLSGGSTSPAPPHFLQRFAGGSSLRFRNIRAKANGLGALLLEFGKFMAAPVNDALQIENKLQISRVAVLFKLLNHLLARRDHDLEQGGFPVFDRDVRFLPTHPTRKPG